MASKRHQREHEPERQGTPTDLHHPPVASSLANTPKRPMHADRDVRTLFAMQALTDTALSHLSLEDLLPDLLERVRAVMQVDNVAILLLNDDTRELEVRAAHGVEEEVIGRVRIPVGAGFAGRIAAERVPLAVEDLSTYPVSSPFLREKLRSVLGVPLLSGDRVLGVVHIGSATPRRFTPTETTLLEQVAARIASAVERSRHFAATEQARKLAEQRVAFLSTTLEALGDGLVITDTHGHILFGNPAFSELLGATAETGDEDNRGNATAPSSHVTSQLHHLDVRDISGKPLSADDLAIARALRGETLAGSNALEVQIRRLDGQEAFLSITGAPVHDAAGTLIGAVMAVRDVTERRRLERQAQMATRQANERAARLEAIFAAVADGLFVYDASGHIVEHNPAAAAMLASFAPPGTHDESVYEWGRRIGGLRDAAGHELAPEEWPQTRIARGDVLSGLSSVDIRMRRGDGQEAYLSVSGAPLRDEHGNITGSVCLYRDMTDRLELTKTLRSRTHDLEEANAQLHTLLGVLPVGVSIVNAAGKPLLVNDAVRRIWGQNLLMSESAAQYGEYRAWRADTGQRVAADEWGIARALTAGETTVGLEYDIETFDGQRKAILDSAAPLRDASGTITGAVSIIFDITERRQLEQRTRDALEAFIAITRTLVEAPDEDAKAGTGAGTSGAGSAAGAAGAATDTAFEGTPRPRNESPLARRLAELTRGILGCSRVSVSAVDSERMVARPVTVVGLTPGQERQWWVEQSTQQPQPVAAGLLPEDRKRLLAGEVLTLDLTRPPYQIPNAYNATSILTAPMRTQGRLVGLLALDFLEPGEQPHAFTLEEIQIAEAVARLGAIVLERDRLLREREAARAEALVLTEANRRMDEFLGIAGHELRTPITTIKANLQMAERRARRLFEADPSADTGERSQSKGKPQGPLEQLLHLLDRATQSAGRQERLVQDLLDISLISTGQVEYRMASLDLAALVRETVEEQRLSAPTRHITLGVPPEPLVVVADADRLRQVLTNYLTNALKYSEADCPVSVTLHLREAAVRVDVRDQGPGLSAEQQRHLFERFQRVPGIQVVSGSGVGLGLGLYISKTIVEQHGGQVGIESTPGAGSTFWFELPLARDTDSTAHE